MRWLAFLLLGVSMICQAEQQVQGAALNECLEPELMIVPDGHKASSKVMLQVQGAVETYIQDTEVFLACLLGAEKAQGDALTFEQKKESITRYNLAVARLEGLVEGFNQQLRAYKKSNAQ